jgi:uncharacterized protein (TIGR03118 family)
MPTQVRKGRNLFLWLMVAFFFMAATPRNAIAQYNQANLVSTSSPGAANNDPNLVNPWGLAFFPNGPFWVSDNGTGVSTLYDHSGASIPLVVTIPPAPSQPFGPTGFPTGIVANPTSDFVISKNGNSGPALFLFATLDGTISGWNPNVDPTNAVIIVDNSTKSPFPASYSGLAIGRNSEGQNVIYAADGGDTLATANNEIDMYDGQFNFIGHFGDANPPSGMTVYGIQNVGGNLVVTYAAFTLFAGGAVDVFNTDGKFIRRLAENGPEGPLEGPWGTAHAPNDFGPLSNALLIGNVDDGRINAFARGSGKFLGAMTRPNGSVLAIPGLWGLEFGDGNPANGDKNQLFFNAGVDGYLKGLFGMITAKGTD